MDNTIYLVVIFLGKLKIVDQSGSILDCRSISPYSFLQNALMLLGGLMNPARFGEQVLGKPSEYCERAFTDKKGPIDTYQKHIRLLNL